jgi:Flp pilus assembly protein TadG
MRAAQRRLRRFVRAYLRFRRHRRGNVAITFALALIPILGFIGAAIDYSRANAMKVDLQAALDSTALMVSKNAASMTQDDLTSTARSYFQSLFHPAQAENINFSITYSTTGGSNVVVDGSADMKTEFVSIIGFNTITIGGTATARWGSTRLRVALVLDTTGSMGDAGKIDALKTATKNLLKQLKGAASTDGDVYVSIIPFSKDVSVGANNYSTWESSIDWSQDWTNVAPTASTRNSAPGSDVGPGSSCPYSSRNDGYSCVTQPGGTTQANTIPASGSNKGNICPSNSFGCYDSVAQTTVVSTGRYASCYFYSNCSCSGRGNNTVCSITSYSHTWFVDKSKWKGCITDRGDAGAPSSQNYDQNVAAPTSGVSASLFPAEQYAYCPSAMVGLSYDWTTMNSVVDAMTPNGSTNQPIGLVSGWQSLVGGGPFTAPAMESNYTYKQTIILLTDGLNTQDRWYGDGSHTSTDVDNRMYDNNGAGTCANIKAAGIDIYTIQVNTGGDPTSTLLQHCASSSDKFFLLTSADQIITTFQKIGTNLSQLRIAK